MRQLLRLVIPAALACAVPTVAAAPAAAAPDTTRGQAWVVAYSAYGGTVTGLHTAWQSNGGLSSVTRPAPGIWTVRLGGFTSGGGNVQLTQFVAGEATTAGLAYCGIQSWYPDATGQVVQVRCWEPDGSAANDAAFGVLFDNSAGFPSYSRSAFWQGSGSWSGTIYPDPAWVIRTAPRLTRTGVGSYTVEYLGPIATPFPLVTAWGTQPRVCNVVDWRIGTSTLSPHEPATFIRVACYNFSGALADTGFSFSLSSRSPLGMATTGGSIAAAKPVPSPTVPTANNVNTRFGTAQAINSHISVGGGSMQLTIPGFPAPDTTVVQTLEGWGTHNARCYGESVPFFATSSAAVTVSCFTPGGAVAVRSVLGGVWDLDG